MSKGKEILMIIDGLLNKKQKDKFFKLGLTSAQEIANLDPKELSEILGCSKYTSEILVERAKNIVEEGYPELYYSPKYGKAGWIAIDELSKEEIKAIKEYIKKFYDEILAYVAELLAKDGVIMKDEAIYIRRGSKYLPKDLRIRRLIHKNFIKALWSFRAEIYGEKEVFDEPPPISEYDYYDAFYDEIESILLRALTFEDQKIPISLLHKLVDVVRDFPYQLEHALGMIENKGIKTCTLSCQLYLNLNLLYGRDVFPPYYLAIKYEDYGIIVGYKNDEYAPFHLYNPEMALKKPKIIKIFRELT